MSSLTSASWNKQRPQQQRPPLLLSAVPLVLTLLGAPAHADVRQDGTDPRDKETKAEAPERPEDMPLAELPEPPNFRLGSPRPRALEAIDRLLNEVVDAEPSTRERAAQTVLEAKRDWVSGVARRIDRIAERADKKEMKKLLGESRDRTRDRIKEETGKRGETPDYLEVVLEHPAPQSQAWRDLTQLLALSRMLTAIGTTEASREIIRIYVRFGEFMRIDCQRQLEALGDLSVAALIETRRHQAPAIAAWAEKRLKLRKKLSAHAAVRTDSPTALADVLVALGRNGDPDSTKLLISFAGTEQTQIRVAARQGIALLGDVAAWQLRDAYLNTTGRRPPRDWTWKRTARELFTEFDRLRLEKIYKIYGAARKAGDQGDLKKMREGYDQVLTLSPEFEKREDMVEGYRRYAESVAKTDLPSALLAYRRAERIDGDAESQKKTEAARLLLEAAQLRERDFIDTTLLDRAKALDSETTDQANVLATPGVGVSPWGASSRYLVAGAVTLVAFLGAAWVMLTSIRKRPELSGKDSAGSAPPPAPSDRA